MQPGLQPLKSYSPLDCLNRLRGEVIEPPDVQQVPEVVDPRFREDLGPDVSDVVLALDSLPSPRASSSARGPGPNVFTSRCRIFPIPDLHSTPRAALESLSSSMVTGMPMNSSALESTASTHSTDVALELSLA